MSRLRQIAADAAFVLVVIVLVVLCAMLTISLRPDNAHAVTITKSGTVLRNQVVQGDLSIQGASDVWVDGCTFPTARFLNVNKWTLSGSKNVRITNCTFPVLGQGVTGVQSHIVEWWNADSCVFANNRLDITIETGLDNSAGGYWNFDVRHLTSRDNRIAFHTKRSSYAIWRWRSGGAYVGCFGNNFVRDTITVDGVGGQLLPSSSATCDGSEQGCVGQWKTHWGGCIFDASACTGPVEMIWQGGAHDQHIVNCTFKVPVRMYDLHNIRIYRSRFTNLKFTDEYQRPMPRTADVWLLGTTWQTLSIAPRLAALPYLWLVNVGSGAAVAAVALVAAVAGGAAIGAALKRKREDEV